jgi:hypothetical protein
MAASAGLAGFDIGFSLFSVEWICTYLFNHREHKEHKDRKAKNVRVCRTGWL